MRTLDDILRRAKRLKRDELSVLVKQLDEHLSRANGHRAAQKGPYARTLALSGTARSNSTDVSSHKGKYLAEAYAPRRKV
jgi:hypothetical protein